MRGVLDSMISVSLDVRLEVEGVLTCDDRVFAGIFGYSATRLLVDGGGALLPSVSSAWSR
jgi:hypothetical protein